MILPMAGSVAKYVAQQTDTIYSYRVTIGIVFLSEAYVSVKHALLALLEPGPSSAYRLKKEFDLTTNSAWPLNVGQVSTTLRRLERDGLVAEDGADEPSRWLLTDAGRDALALWWSTPVLRLRDGRDELVIKISLALGAKVDLTGLIQRQRSATQGYLHDLNRALRTVPDDEPTARLILLNHVFASEAELRWLSTVEAAMARQAHRLRVADRSQPHVRA